MCKQRVNGCRGYVEYAGEESRKLNAQMEEGRKKHEQNFSSSLTKHEKTATCIGDPPSAMLTTNPYINLRNINL